MNVRSLTFAMIFSLAGTLAPSASAVTGCTNDWLRGNFAMQFSGMTAAGVATGVGGVPVPTSMAAVVEAKDAKDESAPAAGVTRLYMDGAGSLAGYSAINLKGTWLRGNISGTYEVNSECSVAFSLTDAAGATQHFTGVIAGQGDSVFILQTDAGTGVSGLLKQVRGFCDTQDLAGTFAIQYAGTVLGAVSSSFSSTGILSLDGQGNATALESRYSGGAPSQVASTGAITISPDCSVVLKVTAAAGPALNFFGFVTSDRKQLLLVQSDAGTAVKGSVAVQ